MRNLILILVLFLGCSSPVEEKSHVITLEDNGARLGSKIGATFRVKLKVYPPYKWHMAANSNMISGPTRIKGDVPGDVEYDIFYIDVAKTDKFIFYLAKDWPRDFDRSFEFHVIAYK